MKTSGRPNPQGISPIWTGFSGEEFCETRFSGTRRHSKAGLKSIGFGWDCDAGSPVTSLGYCKSWDEPLAGPAGRATNNVNAPGRTEISAGVQPAGSPSH